MATINPLDMINHVPVSDNLILVTNSESDLELVSFHDMMVMFGEEDTDGPDTVSDDDEYNNYGRAAPAQLRRLGMDEWPCTHDETHWEEDGYVHCSLCDMYFNGEEWLAVERVEQEVFDGVSTVEGTDDEVPF